MDNKAEDIEQLQAEIAALKKQLGELASQAGRVAENRTLEARDFARELQKELGETLDAARDRSHDLIDRARDKSEQTIDSLEKKIEQYPLLSLFLVFIAGLLVGRLFDRES
ncbi:MAG: hypothetical protein P1U64_03070 [Alcanivoracaceae bacterium]|nr:hypothetical protein [Alcanivoracaceae bacterium]